MAKYFTKGSRIGVAGTIQTRTYNDRNGNKRYVTEVVADEVEFAGSKTQNQDMQKPTEQESRTADELFAEDLADFQPLDDSELPFWGEAWQDEEWLIFRGRKDILKNNEYHKA